MNERDPAVDSGLDADPGADPAARDDAGVPRARVHVAEWSPWIWVLPAIVVLVVGWLVVRYGLFGGGEVTVRFAEARGLERYNPVRYRGAKVGSVQKIEIDDELNQVIVRIAMDGSMETALNTGTAFWIVEPGVESAGLGGILAGTYVGISPGEGEPTRDFTGWEHPPVLTAPGPGKRLVLAADRRGSVSIGAPVEFQGMSVGRVLGSEYDPAARQSLVHVFVGERFADRVRETTRFYRSGGLEVSLEGGGLEFSDTSLASLLGGGVAFYTPEILAGEPLPEGSRLRLHDSRAAALAAAGGPHLVYRTEFSGPVRGLAPGTPVRMRGVEVGHVREVRLRYDAATVSLETPVELELDPRRLELDRPPPASVEELQRRMNDALAALVRRGLRATLSSSLLVPGAGGVALEVVAAPGTGELLMGAGPPVIPAAAGGDGIGDAMAAIQDVAAQVRALPLREIGANLESASARADALVGDPRLGAAVDRLDRALADFETVAATARDNAEPIVGSLRRAAASAESAAATVDDAATTVGENVAPIAARLRRAAESVESAAAGVEELVGESTHQGYGVGELVEELTRAAEAVRALASYLTEHPEALVKGRGDE